MIPHSIGSWTVIDSGIKPGLEHMAIDTFALGSMVAGSTSEPLLRFFQWAEPAVSYGYLLDPVRVEGWARLKGGLPIVKRPTGGGAVCHNEKDLSLSLIWPRSPQALSEHPRTCYAQIHNSLQRGLMLSINENLSLFAKSGETCDVQEPDPWGRFSVCFQEPVCNDVMMGKKKVIGGALRITKQAILYQGTIQIESFMDLDMLKENLAFALEPLLSPMPTLISVV